VTVGIDFAALPRPALEAMLAAGKEVRENARILARTGDNPVGELLRGHDGFTEWTHYPAGDVADPVTHAVYYYHAHPTSPARGEHGHFHTFLRASGMPPGVRPAPVEGLARSEIAGEAMSHLVAIAMDSFGVPIRLFATNRWVTGEVWYAGPDVVAMLDRFVIAQARPSWPVNRWIGAMLRLFRPQIEALVAKRDAGVAAWRESRPERNALEDRELEIVSEVAIDVERQIAAVRAALARGRVRSRATSSPR
jgi:hypothetical protein